MNRLSVSYRRDGAELSAHLSGRLTSTSALKLTDNLHREVDPWEKLIIDLTKVTAMDTTGLNVLFQTNLRCIHKNAQMVLKCQKNHPVNALIELTHSTREFEMQII